jgi:hypothetical protein
LSLIIPSRANYVGPDDHFHDMARIY